MELVPGTDDSEPRPGVKLTYDDFVLFPDDGKRHELIDGEHYVTPSPNPKHQQVSANLDPADWAAGSRAPDRAGLSRAVRRRVLAVRRRGARSAVPVERARGRGLDPRTSRARRSWSSRSARPARASATRRSSGGSTSAPACRSTGSSIRSSTSSACTAATEKVRASGRATAEAGDVLRRRSCQD